MIFGRLSTTNPSGMLFQNRSSWKQFFCKPCDLFLFFFRNSSITSSKSRYIRSYSGKGEEAEREERPYDDLSSSSRRDKTAPIQHIGTTYCYRVCFAVGQCCTAYCTWYTPTSSTTHKNSGRKKTNKFPIHPQTRNTSAAKLQTPSSKTLKPQENTRYVG